MEMQAMGIPVVSYGGAYTPYHAKIFDLDSIAETVIRCWEDLQAEGSTVKEDTLRYAKENYDRAKWVPEYIKLYKKVLKRECDKDLVALDEALSRVGIELKSR